MPVLRKIAKDYKNDHNLASELWQNEVHEMKILATIIDNPKVVTVEQADKWTSELYSWDLCDQLSINLLAKSEIAETLISRYITDKKEFVKRTAFAIISSIATKDKNSPNQKFLNFLKLIRENCDDERNYVKKGANWAIKNIGKRNLELAGFCKLECQNLIDANSKNLNWIGRKTLNELNRYYETK